MKKRDSIPLDVSMNWLAVAFLMALLIVQLWHVFGNYAARNYEIVRASYSIDLAGKLLPWDKMLLIQKAFDRSDIDGRAHLARHPKVEIARKENGFILIFLARVGGANEEALHAFGNSGFITAMDPYQGTSYPVLANIERTPFAWLKPLDVVAVIFLFFGMIFFITNSKIRDAIDDDGQGLNH